MRSARIVTAALTCAASLMVANAPKSNAEATGCTWAPGGIGAEQCIWVYGTGLYVPQVSNMYYASPTSGYGANVCNRRHNYKFTEMDNTIRTADINPSSCILGMTAVIQGDMVRWYPRRNFHDGRGMCARSNNSDTGGTWTPFACETIER